MKCKFFSKSIEINNFIFKVISVQTNFWIYFCRDENPLGRDFTYVDDIVDGIMASLDYNPTECGERYVPILFINMVNSHVI